MEEKQKRETKTRTSITIDPAVLEEVRKHCEAANISVSSFIESAVHRTLHPVAPLGSREASGGTD